MKYRAILTGHTGERPVQALSNSYLDVREWAQEVLRSRPDGEVEVYRTSEELMSRLKREDFPELSPAPDASAAQKG